MADATDRAVFWTVSGVSATSPRLLSRLRVSLATAQWHAPGAALLVLHDGRLRCADVEDCLPFPPGDLLRRCRTLDAPPACPSCAASCQPARQAQLRSQRLYLMQMDLSAHGNLLGELNRHIASRGGHYGHTQCTPHTVRLPSAHC